jgi:adenylate kinase
VVPGARLVILGKQGAGKGTQCVSLSRHYVIAHISTGEIFRAAAKSGTEFGRKAKEFMDAGELVPDEVVNGLVRERLTKEDTKRGFLLDGYPRNVQQAETLDAMLLPRGIDLVIDIEVATEVVLKRLAGRRVCVDCGTNYSVGTPHEDDWSCDRCGGKVVEREDDTEFAIKRRLRLYEEQTEPLIAWYMGRDKLVSIDGIGTAEKVTARIVQAIDARMRRA